MKESSSYGWAFLAALLLHGALALVLNATVRFRAAEPPEKAGPLTLQVLLPPAPETEAKPLRVIQARAGPAVALKPAVEAVADEVEPEAVKPQEPAWSPNVDPLPQASQVPAEASAAVTAPAGEPETSEREVSVGTGANGTLVHAAAAPGGSRDVVIDARPLSAIDPLFPIGSRIRGEQGDVRFQIWISADGKLERTQILETSGYPALDEAAARALKGTPFAPRKVNGNTVPGTLTIMVRFRLDG